MIIAYRSLFYKTGSAIASWLFQESKKESLPTDSINPIEMLGLKLIKVLLAGGSAESWNSQKTELSSLGVLTKNRYVELGRNLLCSY